MFRAECTVLCVYIFILCMDYDVLIIGTLWLNYRILIFASDVVVPYSDVMNWPQKYGPSRIPQRNSGVNQSKVNSLDPIS